MQLNLLNSLYSHQVRVLGSLPQDPEFFTVCAYYKLKEITFFQAEGNSSSCSETEAGTVLHKGGPSEAAHAMI